MNKIWNASRFAMMHIDVDAEAAPARSTATTCKTVERWILSRLNDTHARGEPAALRSSASTRRRTRSTSSSGTSSVTGTSRWPSRCSSAGTAPTTTGSCAKRVLLEVLDRSLRLLHPFMPFVTEEIWQKLGGVEPSIMVAPYPIAEEVLEDREAERLIERGARR